MVLAVDELDAPRLTDLLRHSDVTAGSTVLAVECHPVGAGQVASCVELVLTVDGLDDPVAVIAKGPSDDPVSLATSKALHLYEREVRFYADVAPTVAIRTPKCHHAAYDETTGRFLLLMESLTPAAAADQREGLSIERAELALVELAGLHAPHWGTSSIDATTFARGADETETVAVTELLPALFAGFLDRFGDELTAPTRAVVEWLAPRLAAYYAGRPGEKTVQHGDFRTDNLLFDGRGGEVPMATVDWQMVTLGAAALDVAYLLTTSLDTEDRRRHEDDLLDAYHERLCTLGVTGYDRAALFDDYAFHAFQGVTMLVCAAMLVERTDRGDAMFLTMIERSAAAVDDHDARRRLGA
ncbi:MAG TPA: phosphotransferase [Acidimicrobiales bacterium]|nr:phosphotransferase [Acidimicrobiales bacterium]